MCAFVVQNGFAKRTRKIVAVLSPNIVGVWTIHGYRLAKICTLTVPFDDDEGTIISHPLDFFNVFVYHNHSVSLRNFNS